MSQCASVSLDLDNKWSYLKTHGNDAWQAHPSYLDTVIPRILESLERLRIRITFFVVGQDAALAQNEAALRSLAAAGHEIASHSFHHDPWLHLYSEDELEVELTKAEEAIESATGYRPTGFRGPGFSLSTGTLRVLARRGYQYDATVFPNLLNPLARAYFFATSNLSAEEKEQRKALFGSWKEALKPVKPFRWELDGRQLLELPVTTMPVFRVPIHLSYIIYLAKFSRMLALSYFRFALLMCRLTSTEPSMLLHPLDFLGRDDDRDLRFFPGMDLDAAYKMEILERIIRMLANRHRIVTMGEHVREIEKRKFVKSIRPRSRAKPSAGGIG